MAHKKKIVKILDMKVVRNMMGTDHRVFFLGHVGITIPVKKAESRLDDSRNTHQWSTAK